MNITYTDHFVDPVAQKMGARQNIRQMMLLFWQLNAPDRMGRDKVWIEDTEEQIDEWLDEREPRDMVNGFNPVALSNFMCVLVRASHESYEDHTNPRRPDVPGRPPKETKPPKEDK